MSRVRATYVVGIAQDVTEIQHIQSQISAIKGVADVHFNYLTRRLTISYDGAPKTLAQIDGKLQGLTRVPHRQ